MAVRAGTKEASSQLGDFGPSLKFLCFFGLRSQRPARSHGGARALTLVTGKASGSGYGTEEDPAALQRPQNGHCQACPGGGDSLGQTPTPQHSISVTLTLRRQSGGRRTARLTKGQGTPGSCPLLPPTQQSCRWRCPSLAPRVTPGPAAEKPGFRAVVQTACECWGPPPSPWP